MTNEEAILDLQFLARRYDELDQLCYSINVESLDIAINSIQENAKLKAEIEQWQSTNLKLVCELTRIECENHQLKSELEQSIKEKSEVISKIEYALNECEPVYNKCAVVPQAKPVYDLAMNYCLDLLKGATNGN